MTLEQLRIFVAVAEREHVTRAAADLNLTQSATSAAVAALEARYDTKLFDRIGRRIELTAAGRLFLDEARAVLARAAAAETLLTDLAGLRRGALSLAASQTVANYWLPPLLHEFQTRYPGVSLSLRIGNSLQVAGWVRDASADIGVIEGSIEDPLLHASIVADDDLVLVVAPHHPWAGLDRVAPAMLKESAWVVREAGSGTRATLEEWLTHSGLAATELPVALTLPSNESVRSAVAAGAGATVISRVVVAAMLRAGTLVALEIDLPKRHFYALRHKERHVTRARQAFDQLLAGQMPAILA
jgi:DNA-binding transcriptional LysR family regulator